MFKWGEGRKREFECYSPMFLQGGECEGIFQHSLQEKAALSDVIVPLKKVKGGFALLHPTNCPGAALCKLCVHEKTYHEDGLFYKNRNFPAHEMALKYECLSKNATTVM